MRLYLYFCRTPLHVYVSVYDFGKFTSLYFMFMVEVNHKFNLCLKERTEVALQFLYTRIFRTQVFPEYLSHMLKRYLLSFMTQLAIIQSQWFIFPPRPLTLNQQPSSIMFCQSADQQ